MMRGGGVTQTVGLWVSFQLAPVDQCIPTKKNEKKKIIIFYKNVRVRPRPSASVRVRRIHKALYPVTFGNDDKSHQNKSHNEITVQLCKSGIIFAAKSKVHRININLGTNVNRIICRV